MDADETRQRQRRIYQGFPDEKPGEEALTGLERVRAGGTRADRISSGRIALSTPGGNLEQSSRVQAVVTWAAPTYFLAVTAQALPCSTRDYSPSPASTKATLLGCVPSLCPDHAIAASPVTYATGDDPPFLLLQGDAVCTVPPAQNRLLNDALVAAGIRDVTLVYAPGIGHDSVALSRYNDGALRVLDRHLKDSVGERPFVWGDAIRTSAPSGAVSGDVLTRQIVVRNYSAAAVLGIRDAVLRARKAAGLDTNP